MSKNREKLTRRDFMKVSAHFGMTSTLIAAGTLGAGATVSSLARAAESTQKERYSAPPKFQLKFGASGFNEKNLDIQKSAQLFFARDLEERTNGAIRVEFIGSNQICGQTNCVKKTQQGIIDMYSASTQNSAGGAPYLNVLDYAYMFPSRASQFHFFYSKKSEPLFREPLRQRHKMQFLFTHCELRGIQLGLKWKDKPLVTSIDQLAGTKNRVTGTQLGRIAMQLMNLNPVPIAWEETLDGLKQGLIDGAETWMGAVAYAGMAPVVSQCVDLKFFSGTEHTAMSLPVFDKLGSDLQDDVMESAYVAQIFTQGMNEAALTDVIGATNPPRPGTIFAENNTRVATLSDAELRKAEEMCSPEFNPEPWEQWRDRLNKWSGGHDTYQEIYDIAREIPRDTSAVNVPPQRWWMS
ncbi:2,3-diketo-L-gulonate-binding periplasmic protein YiaO precursor [Grimontia celer]|uniref:2,3-diketo-L-gulonate-binding periplasmic protein YiaO n=2 Tax=Grimontia celer TaxID=1796497 RepID=A0A128F4D5_9GAMM|nr:2,3-diketo-L-gulonate-binding periplasmic protein YiaO precursor [Grimontia celer]